MVTCTATHASTIYLPGLSVSAPTGTRTQTVRILSPLPLPIGLWGPRLMLETGPARALARRQEGDGTRRQCQRGPRIAKPDARFFGDLVDRLGNPAQTAR